MVGPVIQQNIFNILLRFRKNKIAFTADDRRFQHILWRENQSETT